MTMTRYRRVAELWNWLPGFRGVAEHESVNEAASALNVSPSALSRTVKLLESALGAPADRVRRRALDDHARRHAAGRRLHRGPGAAASRSRTALRRGRIGGGGG